MVFLALVLFVAATRLVELRVSQRRRRALIGSGARAISETGFAGMVTLHVAVLAGAVIETLVFRRSVPVWFGLAAALGVLGAGALRVSAIRNLGEHWNVRIIDSTAFGVVTSGPYRFVRHPNYVAVFLELLLLPLVQGAWLTAALGAGLHVVVLRRRILLEEAVLFESSAYRAAMAHKPRFLPRLLPAAAFSVRTRKS
ncbi:MAG TPA: isoprenylcysteine carboxylmethyltransferase family protein [Polyangiaceae bacterium]